MIQSVESPPLAAPPELDTRQARKLTALILLIAALARLPFIWRGFGGHPDEWLVVRSGLDLWLHGKYIPSRGPGYLLDEVIMGGLAWLGGSPACAIAATGATLVTLAYLRGLARLNGVRDSFWLVLAFSFEPWFWASGTHDLDYVWGTGALVAALYYVERRQFILAGLCCSIGFGFRPSSLLWIAPVFLRVMWIERAWQGRVRFAVSAAIPAFVPILMLIARLLAPTSVARADIGGQIGDITQFIQYPLVTSLLAVYHFVELMGQIPAVLLIAAACIVYRHRLLGLFRTEGWVWTYVLIFAFLLVPFMSVSEKPEYMLPALPGLFIMLGRCLSNGWWVAITAAFLFNAFFSFGFGHAPVAGGLRVETSAPSLRPGALLWYGERARAANDLISRTGAVLSESSKIIRTSGATDHLDEFYVSSLLSRGPEAQARIGCPLLPAAVSYAEGRPLGISSSRRLRMTGPETYPILICCTSMSAIGLSNMPPSGEGELKEAIGRFCATSSSETAWQKE
jgi:hypothetical protein